MKLEEFNNELTLITCSYNTPFVLEGLLKSWIAMTSGASNMMYKLIIMENSSNDETVKMLDEYDIPYHRNKNGCHGPSIDKAFKLCKTKYALLVDTDIVFLLNPLKAIYHFTMKTPDDDWALMGHYITGDYGSKQMYPRIAPWFSFINIENIKKQNIQYFDEQKMKNSFKMEKWYDVGSTFFQDITTKNLKICPYELDDILYKHFFGMSWGTNKYDPNKKDTFSLDWDPDGSHNNKALYDATNLKTEAYKQYIKSLDKIKISNRFYYD